MWNYEKRLQYPVKISRPNAKMAQVIMSQFGGPDGELAASMRYLSQRYTMPYKEVTGILTDIGTEELAHMEIVSAIIYQLTKDLSLEESRHPVLINITWTTHWHFGHRRLPEPLGLQPIYNPKGTQLQTFMKIWRLSRKPAPHTTIFYVW